jgi:hypothetical protein
VLIMVIAKFFFSKLKRSHSFAYKYVLRSTIGCCCML